MKEACPDRHPPGLRSGYRFSRACSNVSARLPCRSWLSGSAETVAFRSGGRPAAISS
jgi:hypothetical protein